MSNDREKPSMMGAIKSELSLLWESLASESSEELETPPAKHSTFLKSLSVADVRLLSREMSNARRKLNRRLEALNKEIELNTAKLEALRKLNIEDEAIKARINELAEQGQKLSQELNLIDEKMKTAREQTRASR